MSGEKLGIEFRAQASIQGNTTRNTPTSKHTTTTNNPSSFDAVERFWEGVALRQRDGAKAADGAFRESERLLGSAIDDDPDFTGAYLLRASLRIEDPARARGAVQDCNEVLARRPDLARAYFYKGVGLVALAEDGDAQGLPQAIQLLNQASARLPPTADLLGTRGMAQLLLARGSNPTVTYDFQALRILPATFGVRGLDLLARAELDFAKAAELANGADAVTWRAQGAWSRALRGDASGAIEEFQRLAQDERSNGVVLSLAAGAQLLAGNYDVAEEAATVAVQRGAGPLAVAFRAAARFAQHDYVGARSDLEALSALGASPSKETREILEQMRQLAP